MQTLWELNLSNSQTNMIVVFWTIILLNPQTSDGGRTPIEFVTIDNIYPLKSGILNVEQGDVLHTEHGDSVLVYDNNFFFQLDPRDVPEKQLEIECNFYKYPTCPMHIKSWKVTKAGKSTRPDVALALAEKLAGKYLPYHHRYCTKNHWNYYIFYGQIRKNDHGFKECPLTAPLNEVSAYDISSGAFQLRDSNGKYRDFAYYEIPRAGRPKSPKRGKRSDSSNQVARSGSSKRGGRSESSKQAGGSEPSKQAERSDSSKQGERSESWIQAVRSDSSGRGERSLSSKQAVRSQSSKQVGRSNLPHQSERSNSPQQVGGTNSKRKPDKMPSFGSEKRGQFGSFSSSRRRV